MRRLLAILLLLVAVASPAMAVDASDAAGHFTNYPYGEDTALDYFGARYYDPAIGRFMSIDPAGPVPMNPQTFNRYAYCLNNPYKYVDPDGEFIDLALDLAFIASDIAAIASEGWSVVNTAALVGDVAGAVLPGVTGVGKGIKAADKLVDGGKGLKNGPQFVYRGDTRSAGKIFTEGFSPRGSSTDLLSHAIDNTDPASVYVSTSKSADVASGFANNVYVIRNRNGIDVNAVLGSKSPYPDELEIAIPGGVSASDVRALTLKDRSILNPNYKP